MEKAPETDSEIAGLRRRMQEHDAAWCWTVYPDREVRRLLTVVNNRQQRTEFCGSMRVNIPAIWIIDVRQIVPENGDAPLVGFWPP